MISSIIESMIKEINKVCTCYSQLPLEGVDYPFAVIEETISQTRPKFQCNFVVDLWNNKLNDGLVELDQLATNLYDIAITKTDLFYWGKWETIQNVAVSEEGLTRKQIIIYLKGFFK